MILTTIGGKIFQPRQRELERHQNGGVEMQRDVLMHLVGRASNTEYGRKHAFSEINNYEQFV